MTTLLRRYDGVVWVGTTIYKHCSILCYLLFFSRHPGPAPAELLNSVGGYQAGVHCPAGTAPLPRPLRGHPFASEGEFSPRR